MEFYDPVVNQPQMDWTNYLTIGFLAILISLGVLGSILSLIKKDKSSIAKLIKCFSYYDNFTKIITIPKSH